MRWIIALLTLLLPATTVLAGDIYTCKGARGENVYQNAPCATSTKEVAHRTYDSSMSRAADGSAGATERIYTPPPTSGGSYAGGYAPTSAGGAIDYGSSVAALPFTARTNRGGMGSTAYQRGEVRGTRCVTPKGRVYYVAGDCSTSMTYAGTQPVDWHQDQVQGVPGAVMTGPNEAMNPMTGWLMQLQAAPTVAPVYQRTRDAGTTVDANAACAGARAAAAGRFDHRADQRVQDLCRSGRSMYDQQRSAGRP